MVSNLGRAQRRARLELDPTQVVALPRREYDALVRQVGLDATRSEPLQAHIATMGEGGAQLPVGEGESTEGDGTRTRRARGGNARAGAGERSLTLNWRAAAARSLPRKAPVIETSTRTLGIACLRQPKHSRWRALSSWRLR